MKNIRKIIITLFVTIITIFAMSSVSNVYGFDVFSDAIPKIIKNHRFMPNTVLPGGTFFCINPGGSFNASLSESENRTYYAGSTIPTSGDLVCEGPDDQNAGCDPDLEDDVPWENRTKYFLRYTATDYFSWSEYPDAAYVLAEMTERGQLESWETAFGIWNSKVSSPKRIGGYEIVGESQAYDTFYKTIHGGYTTNDIFEKVVSDNTGELDVGVNQNEGSYTVGPFKIDYPDGYYNGKNKFSWINSIEAVTDAGTLQVQILDKVGTVINIADLGENGTKTLDNTEFYVRIYSTEVTQMSLKVEFGYVEHCYAQMRKYEGVKVYRDWSKETSGTHRHYYEQDCTHITGWDNTYDKITGALLNADPIYEHDNDDYSVNYNKRRYRAYDYVSNESTQVLMALESTAYKVRKTATIYFKGATIIKPTVKKNPPTDEPPTTPPTVTPLTMELAGYVFLDKDNGKVNTGDNVLGGDEALDGVEVYLHEVGGSVVAKTLSGSKGATGSYHFYNLNAQKQYYVEFVYNGMLYTNVDRGADNNINSSKAVETNRSEFNSKFVNITAYPSNYKSPTRGGEYNRVFFQEEIAETFKTIASNYGSHDNSDIQVYANDCRISAYTNKTYPLTKIFTIDTFNNVIAGKNYNAIYQSGGQYDQLHVNLGIKARPTFDLALYKDVMQAVVEINGKTETYTYNARKDYNNTGFRVGIRVGDSESTYLEALRAKYLPSSGTATSLQTTGDAVVESYTQELRAEEIVEGNNKLLTDTTAGNNLSNGNYAWADIYNIDSNGNAYGLTGNDKLKIHITYKIAIVNQSSVSGAVTEIVDYYDSNYTFENAYIGKEDGTQIGTISPYNDAGNNTVYLTIDESQRQYLGNGDYQYVYVTFGLTDASKTLIAAGLLNDSTLTTYNFAEINGYTTNEGLVDRDSIPGNYKASGRTDKWEDDESQAPAYIYTLRTSRTLEGTVFEDAVTSNNSSKINTNETRYGNGTIDSTDKTIEGIKVELVEVKNGQLISRQTTYTNSKGWYGFAAFVPGDYVIRFTYGSDDKTALTKTSQHYDTGKNATSYNGQDYQSTIYTTKTGYSMMENTYVVDDVLEKVYEDNNNARNTEQNEDIVNVSNQKIKKYLMDGYYWYADTSIAGKSDATDDAARREQVVAYSNKTYGTEITNHKAEVFNSYINQATLRTDEKNGNFDSFTQAQPMEAEVDTKSKNRELVNELERRTYMYAYTAEIPVEVEYTKTQVEGGKSSDKYTYQITGVDFGVVERPRTQLTIDQDIAHVKVTATDGTVLLELTSDGKGGLTTVGDNYQWVNEGKYAEYDKKEQLNVILDDELLSGAKLEITYNITVTNNSESGTGTTRAATIVNYVANNLNFDISDNNGLWEAVKASDIQTEWYSTYINNEKYSNNKNLVDLSTQTTILKATSDNPLSKTYLNPGESVSTTLTLKKTLSAASSSDDLTYTNMSEIVEVDNTVGRYDHGAIPGNQSLEEQPREHDTSGASRYDETNTTYSPDNKIIVTPPTGSTQVYYVLGLTVAVILAAGIFIIKKFVIGKKQ